MEYAYSHNGEDYSGGFDTPEAALSEGACYASERGDCTARVYVGQVDEDKSTAHELMLSADTVLERIGEWLYENTHESAHDHFEHVSKDAVAELDEALRTTFAGWCDKHKLNPNWFTIGKQVEVVFTVGEDDDKSVANALAAYAENPLT